MSWASICFIVPGFGPALVTDDPKEAKQRVNALFANGGGDCPELGMNGLRLALLNSLPNSDVYYFSDAAVKDAYLAQSVISIALNKRCNIFLFITGLCSKKRKRRSLSESDLYERLASSTGGQVVKLSKSNIDKAFKLVRSPVNVTDSKSGNTTSVFREVSLLSIDVNTNMLATSNYSVQSDFTIASITAVLSAAGRADVKVKVPSGIVIHYTYHTIRKAASHF